MNLPSLEVAGSADAGYDRPRLSILTALFAVVTTLAGVDLMSDAGSGASLLHWGLEGTLFLAGLVGLALMIRMLVRASAYAKRLRVEAAGLTDQLALKNDEARELNDQLVTKEREAARWRVEAQALLQGLGRAIDRQFARWRLTESEKEVALLLLKGLSHKEIAGVRGTSDQTTRQQARAVYRKADLTGRHDLAAFFLEDLLLPIQPQTEVGASAQDTPGATGSKDTGRSA